jgi:hypothetical protein
MAKQRDSGACGCSAGGPVNAARSQIPGPPRQISQLATREKESSILAQAKACLYVSKRRQWGGTPCRKIRLVALTTAGGAPAGSGPAAAAVAAVGSSCSGWLSIITPPAPRSPPACLVETWGSRCAIRRGGLVRQSPLRSNLFLFLAQQHKRREQEGEDKLTPPSSLFFSNPPSLSL